jgi:hypothetical protein
MKTLLFFVISLVSCASFSQVLNGSFENGSAPDLSHWGWTCGIQSDNSAPSGGGNWCIKVSGGNTQSCFPGYAYQEFPTITSGQTYLLSGWAYALTSPTVGIYFGKESYGVITLLAGSTTSSTSWTQLSVQSNFTLFAVDTAVVVLFGGLTGGPIQGYGYFDLIDLQLLTGVYSPEQKRSIHIFPIPFSTETTLQSDKILRDATLIVYNTAGQQVKQIKNISGQTIIFQRGNLPEGLFFFQLIQDDEILTTGKLTITDN